MRMSIYAPQREYAVSDLRGVTAKLLASIAASTLTNSDLILGCRQVLDLWIESGGSSLDDPVIGFTGIESQTGHVLGGSQVRSGRDIDRMRFVPGSAAEHAEVEELGRFFDESFKRMVTELDAYLNDR
jgi:hypothetical protein